MVSIIFLIFLVYCGLLSFLFEGWMKSVQQVPGITEKTYNFFSIVVPVRNEEKNIGFLIEAIINQNYPPQSFELILVNDHSQDGSLQAIEEKLRYTSFSNVTIASSLKSGKKSALEVGIQQAKGNIIVTTDADCMVGKDWLNSFNSYFLSSKTKMVFGPVKILSNSSVFENMQSIEFTSLIGTGAATNAFGKPSMSNGANLAFRKEVFQAVNGYEGNQHIASGDDEFLMRKIHKKYPGGILFNANKESIVSTQAQNTFSGFLSQRLRWAGKWKAHRDGGTFILASFIFLFHLSVLLLPALALLGFLDVSYIGLLLIAKALLEYRLLIRVTSWLQIKWSWLAFILLQVTYSFYAVFVGLTATFVHPNWKGRKV